MLGRLFGCTKKKIYVRYLMLSSYTELTAKKTKFVAHLYIYKHLIFAKLKMKLFTK